MTKAAYEICQDAHAATGTIGWPAPLPAAWDGPHASMRICPRQRCQDSANRWVRKHTGRDGIYRSFEQARAERAATAAGGE